jgi:preprotein translocase subunit Sec61beta
MHNESILLKGQTTLKIFIFWIPSKIFKNPPPFKRSMAKEISMPGYGGLTRFKEEYNSRFQFGPGAVVAMIIATIVFVVLLNLLTN